MLDIIADREHPLAMYIFTADKKWARRVMSTQQYGGGCINEVCIHMMVKGVPFNGTGHSGMDPGGTGFLVQKMLITDIDTLLGQDWFGF